MKSIVNFAVFLLGFVVLISNVTESAASTAAVPDCSNVIFDLADCLPFVRNGSTGLQPNGTCCDGLKIVMNIDDFCVCEIFKSSAQIGDGINFTKAMTLPSICHLSNPSTITCELALSPSSAPAPEVVKVPGAPGSDINVNAPDQTLPRSLGSSSSSTFPAFTLSAAGLLLVVAVEVVWL